MNGKLFGSILVISSLVLGVGMYYLQNYHWYEEVSMDAGTGVEIQMTPVVGGAPETIIADDFQGIDASSSPLRFRGCFNTPMSIAMLSETYEIEDRAVPLTAPGWFADGVDRVIAVYPDGRAFVWHQLNDKYAK
jgi:hypothetical protein